MDLYQRWASSAARARPRSRRPIAASPSSFTPTATRTIPRRPSASRKVTQAYDLLSDKDKRARYDRGEIDEDGNPQDAVRRRLRRRRRPGRGRRRRAAAPRASRRVRRRRRGRSLRPVRRPVRRRRRRAARRRRRRRAASAAAAPPQKGADVAYRLKVAVRRRGDARSSSGSRSPAARRSTSSCPRGVEDGAQDPPRRPGPGGARRARRRDRHDRDRAAPLLHPRGRQYPPDLPVTLKEAVLGAKVKVPTPEGPVMLTVPKGSTSGKVLRLKGRGFTAKDGSRGDQLVQLAVDLPAGDADARSVRRGLGRRRQPARRAGGLDRPNEGTSPPIARRAAQAAGQAAARGSARRRSSELKPRTTAADRAQAGRASASMTTASSTPATSPIWRCSRCSPSSSSPPRSPGCSARTEDGRTGRGRRSSADCRPTSRSVLAGPIDEVLAGPLGRSALARRDRRPVDRGKLHRDHPRHPPPRLWRQIFGQLLGISAGLDGRRSSPSVVLLMIAFGADRAADLGAAVRGRQAALLRRARHDARLLPHRPGGDPVRRPSTSLFLALTPARYRKIECRKWPGALLVTVWWLLTVELLPRRDRPVRRL